MLQSVFNDADVQPNLVKERLALFECDPDGEIEVDNDGNNNFYLSAGYIYQSGHGREKCSMIQCLMPRKSPKTVVFTNNSCSQCGFSLVDPSEEEDFANVSSLMQFRYLFYEKKSEEWLQKYSTFTLTTCTVPGLVCNQFISYLKYQI